MNAALSARYSAMDEATRGGKGKQQVLDPRFTTSSTSRHSPADLQIFC